MLTTTGMLLIGGGAALLASLFEGALACLRGTEALLVLGAAGAIGLVETPRHGGRRAETAGPAVGTAGRLT